MLCQLDASNTIFLYWVPYHSNILVNETADKLARNGFSIPFGGAIGISSNLLRNIVFDIFIRNKYLNWHNITGQ